MLLCDILGSDPTYKQHEHLVKLQSLKLEPSVLLYQYILIMTKETFPRTHSNARHLTTPMCYLHDTGPTCWTMAGLVTQKHFPILLCSTEHLPLSHMPQSLPPMGINILDFHRLRRFFLHSNVGTSAFS